MDELRATPRVELEGGEGGGEEGREVRREQRAQAARTYLELVENGVFARLAEERANGGEGGEEG